MGDMALTDAHTRTGSTGRSKDRPVTWSDRLTALFMVLGSMAVTVLLGTSFSNGLP